MKRYKKEMKQCTSTEGKNMEEKSKENTQAKTQLDNSVLKSCRIICLQFSPDNFR